MTNCWLTRVVVCWARQSKVAAPVMAFALVMGGQAFALAGTATGSSWSIEHIPDALLSNGELSADACTSPTWCAAVGSFSDRSGTSPLAEMWNDTTWSVQPTPPPQTRLTVSWTAPRVARPQTVSLSATTPIARVGWSRFGYSVDQQSPTMCRSIARPACTRCLAAG
jgi:hypothetical protein